ncbi:MAG: hypothetical protein PHG47_07720 [Sulfuricella sp.]|nr:hypothetical protein [Sulfuricella sp.]
MQPPNIKPPNIVGSHELREITELLIKHHGLHEGLYDLALEFQIAVGAVGPDPSSIVPGAMIGVRRIGLVNTDKEGPSTVNAAEANPMVTKKAAVKKAAKK